MEVFGGYLSGKGSIIVCYEKRVTVPHVGTGATLLSIRSL